MTDLTIGEERALQQQEGAIQLELDDELKWILGRPNFVCGGVAKMLRKRGQVIEPRAEAEQAACIHWMLNLYLRHGAAAWRDAADAILAEAQK